MCLTIFDIFFSKFHNHLFSKLKIIVMFPTCFIKTNLVDLYCSEITESMHPATKSPIENLCQCSSMTLYKGSCIPPELVNSLGKYGLHEARTFATELPSRDFSLGICDVICCNLRLATPEALHWVHMVGTSTDWRSASSTDRLMVKVRSKVYKRWLQPPQLHVATTSTAASLAPALSLNLRY